jgi:hypothetical protein
MSYQSQHNHIELCASANSVLHPECQRELVSGGSPGAGLEVYCAHELLLREMGYGAKT